MRDRQTLGLAQQRRGDAAVAVTDARHHLRNFGAMRLVRRQIEQQRDGPDQLIAVEGAENDAPATLRRAERA
jgi:hypothetical protein